MDGDRNDDIYEVFGKHNVSIMYIEKKSGKLKGEQVFNENL